MLSFFRTIDDQNWEVKFAKIGTDEDHKAQLNCFKLNIFIFGDTKSKVFMIANVTMDEAKLRFLNAYIGKKRLFKNLGDKPIAE